MIGRAAILVLTLTGLPAAAHPHVFVDVDFQLFFDAQGRLAKIRTHWLYDEFYSLLVIEDRQADKDGDGELSAEELKPLQGFDSDWGEGSDGDLHVSQDDKPIAIGPPFDWSAEWVDGKLGSYHSRAFDPPIDMSKGGVVIQPYDKTYYIAYKIAGPIRFTGRDHCRSMVFEPDLNAADKQLQAEMARIPAGQSPEVAGYPQVGAFFTETAWIGCSD